MPNISSATISILSMLFVALQPLGPARAGDESVTRSVNFGNLSATNASSHDAILRGNNAYEKKDFVEALHWFQKAADQGDAMGFNQMAFLYLTGQGVPRDYRQALILYQKGAEKGLSLSENAIGYIYQRGNGVPQDYTEAMRWYQKAADHGHAPAQTSIGYLYLYGQGVPTNQTEAMDRFLIAAKNGDPYAELAIGEMYRTGQGVTKDCSTSDEWIEKARKHANSAVIQQLTSRPPCN
ncbi:tetratricopeptide repeat protein [Labrys sp. KB_33_2]|uniref:tetratricopeptide repeat protein n=1 Tax=Labrys sp. KB_33_2 TaxID=3237479 RepID=UPI003F8E59E5